jgi:heme/copper-type cytochrome/quinol oxidase subunit 2
MRSRIYTDYLIMLVLLFASDTLYDMNEQENLASRILPTQTPHQDHHYKRIIFLISVVVIIALVAFFAIKFFSVKKSENFSNSQSVKESQAFFAENPPTDKPMTDAEKKATAEFFAKNQVTEPTQ